MLLCAARLNKVIVSCSAAASRNKPQPVQEEVKDKKRSTRKQRKTKVSEIRKRKSSGQCAGRISLFALLTGGL